MAKFLVVIAIRIIVTFGMIGVIVFLLWAFLYWLLY